MPTVALLVLLSLSVFLPFGSGSTSTATNISAANGTNDTVCDEYNPYQQKVLSILRCVTGAVCLLPTALVLIAFLCSRRPWLCGDSPCKNFRRRLVLFITVSTLLYLILFIAQISVYVKYEYDRGVGHKGLCQAIGFFIQYFGWQELLLVSFITIYLFRNHIKDDGEVNPTTCMECAMYIALVIFPFIPAALGFAAGYGESQGWCWIRLYNSDCTKTIVGQVLLWYIEFIFCGFGMIVLFIVAMRCIAKRKRDSGTAVNKEVFLLLYYSGIFLVVNLFEFVSWMVAYHVSDNQPIFILWVFYAILSPVSAAAIPIAFAILYCCFNIRDKGYKLAVN